MRLRRSGVGLKSIALGAEGGSNLDMFKHPLSERGCMVHPEAAGLRQVELLITRWPTPAANQSAAAGPSLRFSRTSQRVRSQAGSHVPARRRARIADKTVLCDDARWLRCGMPRERAYHRYNSHWERGSRQHHRPRLQGRWGPGRNWAPKWSLSLSFGGPIPRVRSDFASKEIVVHSISMHPVKSSLPQQEMLQILWTPSSREPSRSCTQTCSTNTSTPERRTRSPTTALSRACHAR